MSPKYQKLGVVVFVLLALVSLTACQSTRTAGEQVDDGVIVTKVKAKLAADGDINPFNIDVDTNNGVVTLQGQVAKAEARTKAEDHAKSTEGVKRVINLITVGDQNPE